MPLTISIIKQSIPDRVVNSWNILRLENSRPETPRVSGKLKFGETAFSVKCNKMQKWLCFSGTWSCVSGCHFRRFVTNYHHLQGSYIFLPLKMMTLRRLETSGSNYRMTQRMLQEKESWATLEQNSEVGNLNQLPFLSLYTRSISIYQTDQYRQAQ